MAIMFDGEDHLQIFTTDGNPEYKIYKHTNVRGRIKKRKKHAEDGGQRKKRRKKRW